MAEKKTWFLPALTMSFWPLFRMWQRQRHPMDSAIRVVKSSKMSAFLAQFAVNTGTTMSFWRLFRVISETFVIFLPQKARLSFYTLFRMWQRHSRKKIWLCLFPPILGLCLFYPFFRTKLTANGRKKDMVPPRPHYVFLTSFSHYVFLPCFWGQS